MDVYKTHGAFSWSELMTADPEAATAFYGKLFGWTTEVMDMGPAGSYRVVKAGGESVGGVMSPPPGSPPGVPPHWGVYVTVDDVDATVTLCAALGGKVLQPVMEVPGVGRMAVLQDPQGAVFCVMTYSGS